jgi:hypothetical protein
VATFTPLVDAELLVRGFLVAQFPDPVRVVTELPADLGAVPTIQVARIGGQSPSLTMDAANVDVDYFDGPHDGLSARENAKAGALQVRTALLMHMQGYAANGGAVQSVAEISAPRWVPYDNTTLRRFTATYRITTHSIPS